MKYCLKITAPHDDSFPSFPHFISIFLPPNYTVVYIISYYLSKLSEKIPRKGVNLGDKLRGRNEGGRATF